MGLAQPQPSYTVEEYLALERTAEERSEYLDGVIYAMAGESEEHGDISVNLTMIIATQLKGKDCRARLKDTKVRSGPIPSLRNATKGLYSYPDSVIVCEEPQFKDQYFDVLLNPRVVIEILSKSTESFDRGFKFESYRRLPTFQEYVLISQKKPLVERFVRQPDETWVMTTFEGLDCEMVLSSVPIRIPMSEIYRDVEFEMATEHRP